MWDLPVLTKNKHLNSFYYIFFHLYIVNHWLRHMEPLIHSSQGILPFSPALPSQWAGHILSGSQPYSYEGPLGQAVLQKFRDEDFSICYAVTNFLQKIKLSWKEEPLLRLQYVLEGGLQYRGTEAKVIKMRAGEANAVWAPGRETVADMKKGKFEIFQIAFRPELVQALLPGFPELTVLPPETAKQSIGEDRNKDIFKILDAAYDGNTRRFFYDVRIREHLFWFLRPKPEKKDNYHTDEMKERIFRIDKKILEDPTKHFTTKELAKMSNLNEGRLLELFKEIIGVSMFERYRDAKLEKAKKYLLETDERINMLYEKVGYESYSGFIGAFTDRFGLSPLQFRKKYRPF